jgi:hypothetical protein
MHRPALAGFIAFPRTVMEQYAAPKLNTKLFGFTEQVEGSVLAEEANSCDLDYCDEGCAPTVPCEDTVSWSPGGVIPTAFTGSGSDILKLYVERTCGTDVGGNPQTAEVVYCLNDLTAIYGTHYEIVDIDGNVLPNTDTLSWGLGETGAKEICVRIIAGLDPIPGDPASSANCCVEGEDVPQIAEFGLELKTPTNAVIGLGTGTVEINNYA